MKTVIDSYEVLGAEDVCNLCNFSKVHLNRLIKDKKIPARKVSHVWVFAKPDILEFQIRRKEKAKTDKRVKI
jgi:hypothetical protein